MSRKHGTRGLAPGENSKAFVNRKTKSKAKAKAAKAARKKGRK